MEKENVITLARVVHRGGTQTQKKANEINSI